MKVVKYAEDIIISLKNVSVLIDKSVINNAISSQRLDTEVGGICFGYKLSDIEEYRIQGFTLPMEKDVRTKTFFKRQDNKHFALIKEKWDKDNTTMYLGDWHAHPVKKAFPSFQDKKTWKKLAKKSKTSANILIYFIISFDELYITIYNRISECIGKKTLLLIDVVK